MNLQSTIALVTGGASGLGEATVREIVGRGGKAVIVDLNEEAGNALSDELGADAIFCKTDVTSETEVAAALENCLTAFGPVTAAVNFAGIAVAAKTLSLIHI